MIFRWHFRSWPNYHAFDELLLLFNSSRNGLWRPWTEDDCGSKTQSKNYVSYELKTDSTKNCTDPLILVIMPGNSKHLDIPLTIIGKVSARLQNVFMNKGLGTSKTASAEAKVAKSAQFVGFSLFYS